ncbi:MAG: helix-turn-helix domain-containing protein [Acidobacteria bacterium]|nr:helix-turn-helix domain-containing protein [Acidobacteriota bacterium]
MLKDCSEARQFQRIQALRLLDEEDSVEHIADLLRVSRQTIYNWAQRFEQRQGWPAFERVSDRLRSGRPTTAKGIIDPWIDLVIDSDPRDYGYNSTVWTAGLLQSYVKEHHNCQVSLRSLGYALDRLRISWKRPRHTLARRQPNWRQAKGG